MTQRRPSHRSWQERCFAWLCACGAILPLGLLAFLLGDIIHDGWGRIDAAFLTSFPSRKAALAGLLPAIVGSTALILLTAAVALPLGIGAAIYLEEYAHKNRFSKWIEINIANLAGVPSVIYGLLGLEVFVRISGMGRSLLAGACTLALLILPILITATRESLRTVPHTIREAGLGLGATPWTTVSRLVLPMALPGILTGALLSLSRAIGETAPLIVVGALTYMAFLPTDPSSPFTALPLQIFNWLSRPQEAFATNAAAGIIVLLITLLSLNATAVWLRARTQRKLYR